MAATPPPPQRARTPPTPLHGGKHDSFEPFSPRRSSRIHNKQTPRLPAADHSSSKRDSVMPNKSIANMAKLKPTMQRTSSQTYSPPASPGSQEYYDISTYQVQNDTARRQHRRNLFLDGHVSDDDPATKSTDLPRAHAMLPTPAKTPRKRNVPMNPALASTARVLFPGRTAHPDDLVPSPRKARKQSKKTAFSLESFAEACENGGEQIEIYTDSKERMPELDESQDNPFVARSSKRQITRQPKKRANLGMGREIDDAVDNDEGMVYVFRGKKIFRRFSAHDEDQSDEQFATDDEVVTERDARANTRNAGSRPFTRASMKPRLLFPPKSPEPSRNAQISEDEEALTDIEDDLAMATPQPEEHFSSADGRAIQRPATPPASTRKSQRDAALTPDSSPLGPSTNEGTDLMAGSRAEHSRKSPFAAWQRTKPHLRGTSMKRPGQSLESEQTPKRTKVGTSKSPQFH